eukprot:GHVQ01013025.1.p1 GENE.GHVQ01013025.1~~GHVQ01013025.1.p1  ORF type:complete len:386 (-),score=66.30 GHVQ01013025.1:250-1407(-)
MTVKRIVLENYPMIISVFKFLCSGDVTAATAATAAAQQTAVVMMGRSSIGIRAPSVSAESVETFSVRINQYTEMVSMCGLIDDRTCKLKDTDSVFTSCHGLTDELHNNRQSISSLADDVTHTSTTSAVTAQHSVALTTTVAKPNISDKKNKHNMTERLCTPYSGLSRPQWLAAILRLAGLKATKSNDGFVSAQSVSSLLEYFIAPHTVAIQEDLQWKYKVVFSEAVDRIFRKHLSSIRQLFYQYATSDLHKASCGSEDAGTHTGAVEDSSAGSTANGPGGSSDCVVFLRLSSFVELVQSLGITGPGDWTGIFYSSMMIQLDEIHNLRHTQMSLVELLVALCFTVRKLNTEKNITSADPSDFAATLVSVASLSMIITLLVLLLLCS